MREVRRSARASSSIYDSNGRDYLASLVKWPREKLEAWLKSPSVRSHLKLWHLICIQHRRRFNIGVKWINTGEKGYFYNPSDLEENLLFMCLGHGSDGLDYANTTAHTSEWITEEVWARSAWRIVQENMGDGDMFHYVIKSHPAWAYAFAIDILCIAFHSIACRGANSVWEQIINGSDSSLTLKTPTSALDKSFAPIAELDHKSDVSSDDDQDGEGMKSLQSDRQDEGDKAAEDWDMESRAGSEGTFLDQNDTMTDDGRNDDNGSVACNNSTASETFSVSTPRKRLRSIQNGPLKRAGRELSNQGRAGEKQLTLPYFFRNQRQFEAKGREDFAA